MSEVAEYSRHIPLQGTPNFRDYGGYKTSDNRIVRWRKFFRSGQLARLTDEDHQQFGDLDIRLVFDFRRELERERDPSRFPAHAMPEVMGLPIDPGSAVSLLDEFEVGNLDAEAMAGYMHDINESFVFDLAHNYRQMFERLLAQEEGGSLIHCSAGKDRTGFAAAMILSALGVPRETIVSDYMLTAEYFDVDRQVESFKKRYGWTGNTDGVRPLLEVRKSYLGTALDIIDQNFPSVDDYLREVLAVGEAEKGALRSRYLY